MLAEKIKTNMTEINKNIPTVVKKDMWDISVCATCSITSPVVTRGDEENRPWNPLPRVCKEISPQKNPYTHTRSHTLCVSTSTSPLPPSLHYPLPTHPPRATRRWGQTELNLLFHPDPWGSIGIYTPGPENGRDPHSSTLPLLRRRRRRGAVGLHTQEEKEESGNTHRGEM